MKITISIVMCIIFLMPTLASANIQLTQEQENNIDILHEKLAERYPQFKGFNGPRENKEVIGISDETAEVEIAIIDLPTELQKKKDEKDAKKIKKLTESFTAQDKILNDKISEIIDYLNAKE